MIEQDVAREGLLGKTRANPVHLVNPVQKRRAPSLPIVASRVSLFWSRS